MLPSTCCLLPATCASGKMLPATSNAWCKRGLRHRNGSIRDDINSVFADSVITQDVVKRRMKEQATILCCLRHVACCRQHVLQAKCWQLVMERQLGPLTRAVNSGSGNRALLKSKEISVTYGLTAINLLRVPDKDTSEVPAFLVKYRRHVITARNISKLNLSSYSSTCSVTKLVANRLFLKPLTREKGRRCCASFSRWQRMEMRHWASVEDTKQMRMRPSASF